MTIYLTKWHESQSGIEFFTYNERDNISNSIADELESQGIHVYNRSKLFMITDRITKELLLGILEKLNRTNVKLIEK
jgi:hypothetical protein